MQSAHQYSRIATIIAGVLLFIGITCVGARQSASLVNADNLKATRHEETLTVHGDIILDSLHLKSNQSVILTPVIEGPGEKRVYLPSILVNGRAMHYAWLRGSMPKSAISEYDIIAEMRRNNGTEQQYSYTANLPMEKWMLSPGTELKLLSDTCGCGRTAGHTIAPGKPLMLIPDLRLVQITPAVTEQPISIHEGKARVQFEVDRTELHTEPYRCKRGNQTIDNREQLRIITDSVEYAIHDPNVEIAQIRITGYASPESPYTHNDWLATNRSKALADWLGERYNLPSAARIYDAVPENWGEFREQVLAATDITEQQRADLLQLIDAPTYGPADFDAKERTLKTDPRFAKLYAEKILPIWFPVLRATKFAISTRLKPLSDEKLAEAIERTPGLLSLNQMMRVARMHPEGSDEFNRIIDIALKYYPDDETANLNAAVAALQSGDLERGEQLLTKAGNTPEAENARGVLAARRGNFEKAAEHFRNASALPEAVRNLNMIQ